MFVSIEKLQQDILYCQKSMKNIIIKHHDQETYKTTVTVMFKDIFQDYLKESGKVVGIENQCPDKLEPKSGYLPKESLKKIKNNLGINND